MLKAGLCILGISCSFAVFAAQPPLELSLGSTWECKMEGLAHICIKPGTHSKAAVVWSAKAAGKRDTFQAYKQHLQAPIQKGGVASIPEYVRTLRINGQEWIDALHWQSERKGYYTRYLAAVNGKLAVLLTLTADKSDFDDLNRDLGVAVEHLKLRE